MKITIEDIERRIVSDIGEILGERSEPITLESHLVGEKAVLRSRELVELLLALEEYAEDVLGSPFDWSGDSAMSARRSIFRTVGSLAAHLHGLQQN